MSSWLPAYMIPEVVVELAVLPLTPAGKVDRRELAATEPSFVPSTSQRAARDPIEIGVASVFSEVLELETVGVGDDFFSLGGHSLLATRLGSCLDCAVLSVWSCP